MSASGAWAGKVTSKYGLRTHPISGKKNTPHEGTDIASKKGTAIPSNVSGKVIASGSAKANGYASSYGNIVVIEDSNGFHHYYAHLDKAVAKKGTMIKAGQLAGNVGSTGNSTGAHLHYEVRKNGKVVNPNQFIPAGKQTKMVAAVQPKVAGVSTMSLGGLSAKYESNGSPGTIARTKGDKGGASYGTYQLTTASGHAQKFANSFGGSLKGKKAGTAAFDKAWKAESSKNSKAFSNAQHNYIKTNHYAPAANKFKSVTGIDASKAPKAVQDMIWSIGVQHGAGGASTIFKNANVNSKMSPKQVITKIYNERMKVGTYFKNSSKALQASVKKRFAQELKDALKML